MTRTLACFLPFALVSSLALAQSRPAPSPSGAGSSASVRDDEARLLFDAGQLAMEQGRYADALDYFERAYALSGRSNMLFNIGTVAERLRRDERALEAYEAFIAQVPTSPMRPQAEARVAILRSALTPTTPAESTPTNVSPSSQTVVIAPAPSATAANAPPSASDGVRGAEPDVAPNGARRTLLIASGGTAIAALATGAWWFERGDAFEACVDGSDAENVCTNRGTIRRQRASAIVTTGALGAGAVTLLIVALTRRSDTSERVASCSPGFVGLSCEMRF